MKTYIATIKGTSPYSQSRHYEVPELEKEGKDEYEKRTWRNQRMADAVRLCDAAPPMAGLCQARRRMARLVRASPGTTR